jgi:hypothetical protein
MAGLGYSGAKWSRKRVGDDLYTIATVGSLVFLFTVDGEWVNVWHVDNLATRGKLVPGELDIMEGRGLPPPKAKKPKYDDMITLKENGRYAVKGWNSTFKSRIAACQRARKLKYPNKRW